MKVEYIIKKLIKKSRKAFSISDVLIVSFIFMILIILIRYKERPQPVYINKALADIDITRDPEQSVCYFCKPLIIKINNKEYSIIPVANYKISGIVLAINTFFIMDAGAEIAPIDVGLAWGKMAVPEYDKYMNYSSSARYLNWNYDRNFPFSYDFLNSHVSHNHIVPANEKILNVIKSLKNKEKIYMEGYLVNIRSEFNGSSFYWNTSLTRFDKEGGACEVFYVKKIRIENNFYE